MGQDSALAGIARRYRRCYAREISGCIQTIDGEGILSLSIFTAKASRLEARGVRLEVRTPDITGTSHAVYRATGATTDANKADT